MSLHDDERKRKEAIEKAIREEEKRKRKQREEQAKREREILRKHGY
jgi:hypothetical protein